jgi:hypothetical protein
MKYSPKQIRKLIMFLLLAVIFFMASLYVLINWRS